MIHGDRVSFSSFTHVSHNYTTTFIIILIGNPINWIGWGERCRPTHALFRQWFCTVIKFINHTEVVCWQLKTKTMGNSLALSLWINVIEAWHISILTLLLLPQIRPAHFTTTTTLESRESCHLSLTVSRKFNIVAKLNYTISCAWTFHTGERPKIHTPHYTIYFSSVQGHPLLLPYGM